MKDSVINMTVEYKWYRFNNSDLLAEDAAGKILKTAEDSIKENGIFKIVLAGGSTPLKTYRILSKSHNDFSKWIIFFGDERFLAKNDPELNYNIAWEAWLKNHEFKKIYPLPVNKSVNESEDLKNIIEENLPFDLVLLGMGEDGHTASLFPGHTHDESELFHYVKDSPKPPSERISLSAKTLSRTEYLYILISGSNKKDAVKAWRSGDKLPVASVSSSSPVQIFIDDAAYLE